MTTILTALAFFALTAWLTVRHLKKTESAPAAHAAHAGDPCPRCRAPLPATAAFCPSCGVSRQVFELVSSKAVEGPAKLASSGGPVHAIVRADVCVGCGTCVAACPEDGAIGLQGKIATVDTRKCVAHGNCVTACPVGAIVLAAGDAVQRVEVPDVGVGFQTNVPGIYIVGELGGRGLIRNAVNEGTLAIEHIAREVAAQPRPPADDVLDVIIVGSGPAGLAAALAAHRAELRYLVLETGDLAASIRKYPRHKLLFSNTSRVPVYGGLWVGDATKERLLAIWQAIIDENELRILTEHKVESVRKMGSDFEIEAARKLFRARRVVLATGRRGTPRRLGVGGEDLPHVFYDIVEMEVFAGRRIVVVGGGDTALESALGLANQPGTHVTLVHRGERFDRANAALVSKLKAGAAGGPLQVLMKTTVSRITADRVEVAVGGAPKALPAEVVIIRVGGEPPAEMLRSIGVRIVGKDIPLAPMQSVPTA